MTIPFNYQDFQSAQLWVKDTIERIYADTEFKDKVAIEYEKAGVLSRIIKTMISFANIYVGAEIIAHAAALWNRGTP